MLVVKSHDAIASWVKLAPAMRKGAEGHLKSVSRDDKIFFPVIATFSESQAGRKITFEAKDLSGKYKLRAKISNGKETVVAEETFMLM